MNKIAIRVDANEIVATGHIMRCRTIAGSLRQMGCTVVFVSADNNIEPYIGGEYELFVLESNWRKMEQEVALFLSLLRAEKIDRVLVDSYQVTPLYLKILRDNGISVMYIDDMKKDIYPVKALLNYSPSALTMDYDKDYDKDTMLLLGTKYIPLREQFWQRRHFDAGMSSSEKEERYGTDGELLMNIDIVALENEEASAGAHRTYGYEDGIKNVFLTTGGADTRGLSELIITAILSEPELQFKGNKSKKIHLLAGRFYRISERVQKYVEDGSVVLHQNVSNVAEIMGSCDFAITPAGTTLFELCAVGVPSVSYVFADNMEPDALYFANDGLVPYAGDFRDDERTVLINIMTQLLKFSELDTASRIEIGNRMKSIIDGQGADRIAEAILDM
ncbi:MAG: hypothetical protein E7302_05145 [Butyrivibrio sp.]|nr:hypothetical protein [Butyrivibrio sp.]